MRSKTLKIFTQILLLGSLFITSIQTLDNYTTTILTSWQTTIYSNGSYLFIESVLPKSSYIGYGFGKSMVFENIIQVVAGEDDNSVGSYWSERRIPPSIVTSDSCLSMVSNSSNDTH
jgi:hypothetical protein